MTAGATATWVYAVTGELDPAVLDSVSGIGGAPVREVREGALSAAASSVDAAAFSEKMLQRRLTEPGELERLARAHHRVIGTVATAVPALPLRLGAVYTADGRVRAMLAERQPEFTRTLGWLAGRAECGVKVWACPDVLTAPAAGRGAAARPEPGRGGGAAYLSRRRDELAARDQGRQRAAAAAADIHELLSGLSVAARQHQLQDSAADPQAGQAREVMLLNGSYLVDAGRLGDFAAAAQAAVAGRGGARADVTGPWPPYSFADGPEGS
jgi:hypothetical protein